MSNLVIGLTGGIGSGKSAVAQYFSDLGINIIDTDVIAREVVIPGSSTLTAIEQQFGRDVITNEGSLNRTKLRDIIFSDEPARSWLENLLHPLIRQQMQQKIKQASSEYCIAIIPLLVENNSEKHIHRILVVDCDENLQIQRAIARDNTTIEQVKKIIAKQATRKARLDVADDVIENNQDLKWLQNEVVKLHKKYLELV